MLMCVASPDARGRSAAGDDQRALGAVLHRKAGLVLKFRRNIGLKDHALSLHLVGAEDLRAALLAAFTGGAGVGIGSSTAGVGVGVGAPDTGVGTSPCTMVGPPVASAGFSVGSSIFAFGLTLGS